MALANILEIIYVSFHQIRLTDTHRHTKTQNGRQTNTRFAISDRSYLSILLIFNSKQSPDLGYIVCKFEENRTKNKDVRVPERICTKWPP